MADRAAERTLRVARAVAVACTVATAAGGCAWAQGETPPGVPGAAPAPRPAYLEGLDLGLPAPETFRAWPPDSMRAWFYPLPWSQLSFNRAVLFGRPVFFVLTVNWSRSAERLFRESLNDVELLRTLNENFITVVVNADLRPDIRERYQTGAWPVVAFLLPNGQPMLSQASDPAAARPIITSAVDKASLRFLVREGATYWGKWPALLMQVGSTWTQHERPDDPTPGTADALASEAMSAWLLGNADRVEGGFGGGARFVVPGVEEYAALRQARSLPGIRSQSRLTLQKLVSSPLFDAREGGVHRVAARADWSGVEYEKLLEGNAALIRELVFALRGEESAALREALSSTARFVVRVLGRPGGGFYLAQEADPSSADGGAYFRGEPSAGPPAVDHLVLAGPNAQAGAALVRAGLWLGDTELQRAGEAALDLVYRTAYRPGRGVSHSIEPAPDGRLYLSAQADVALAFADAYETTGRRQWLDAAKDIVDAALLNFKREGDLRLVDHVAEAAPFGLLVNLRRPLRPNVRLARAMLRLDAQGAGTHYREEALRILERYSGDLGAYGVFGLEGALGVEEAIAAPLRVVLRGAVDDPRARALRRVAACAAWPWVVISSVEAPPGDAPRATLTGQGSTSDFDEPEAFAAALRRIGAGGAR